MCINIERRTAKLTGLQGFDDGGFVQQFAPCAIHQAHAFLHLAQRLRIDHACRLRSQADMQRDVVRLGVELIQRNHGDIQLLRQTRRDVRIVRDHLHTEGKGATRDFDADAPQSDDAQRLAAQLGALQRFLFPLAGVHGGIGAGEEARQRQHESKGVLGDRYSIAAGSVHDDDAALGSGIEIDVIHAHTGAPDDAQSGGLVHHRGVNKRGGADQDGVGGWQLRGKCFFVGRNHRPVGMLSKDFERGGRDFICDYDFHTFTASAYCSAKASCTARTPAPSSKLWDGATFSNTCSRAPITPMASR